MLPAALHSTSDAFWDGLHDWLVLARRPGQGDLDTAFDVFDKKNLPAVVATVPQVR